MEGTITTQGSDSVISNREKHHEENEGRGGGRQPII
jgi:hypothetical protein